MTRERHWLLRPRAHVGAILAVWVLLSAVQWWLLAPTGPADFLYYGLSTAAFLPFSLLLVNFCYHFAYQGETLASAPLPDEGDRPSVAVLYTTFNDIVPLCLEGTEEAVEYPVDFWVLSDSTDPEAVTQEESFASWRRFTREARRGGKAGMINDWLAAHGDEYDYYVSLDADTMLAPGNVTSLVERAEHPANADIAIFQTLKEVHPELTSTAFARIVGRGVKWSTRISPPVAKLVYEQNTYWGSAALIRTGAVRDVGGLDERLICDDFVLTVRLEVAGWRTIVADVYSYEGFPLDYHALRVRTMRWVRANRLMLGLLGSDRVSLGTRLNCLTPVLFYAVAPVLLCLVVFALFVPRFGSASAPNLLFAGAVFGFIFLHRGVAAGRDVRAFLETAALETVVVLGMSVRVTVALLFGRMEWGWIPTQKTARGFTWAESLRYTSLEVVAGLALLAALAVQRPNVGVNVLVLLWAGSFLATPFVLRYTSAKAGVPTPIVTPHEPEQIPRSDSGG